MPLLAVLHHPVIVVRRIIFFCQGPPLKKIGWLDIICQTRLSSHGASAGKKTPCLVSTGPAKAAVPKV